VADEQRLIPCREQVACDPAYEDDVDRTAANDLYAIATSPLLA
jgi:hypothetical protein